MLTEDNGEFRKVGIQWISHWWCVDSENRSMAMDLCALIVWCSVGLCMYEKRDWWMIVLARKVERISTELRRWYTVDFSRCFCSKCTCGIGTNSLLGC